ncbi:LuxR C-terminal-related transcriptional regulator [Streptomyces sp. 8N706]|uniref:LuxR C-terminal-related transcriptional regulator n=1 Tax=Streptomyces sp. 8N706 TaxID=3457416 RepID=UPI003FD4239F
MAIASAPPRMTREQQVRTVRPLRRPAPHFAAVLSSARHDVLLMRSRCAVRPEEIRYEAEVLGGLLQRWVRVHVLWDERLLTDPAVAASVRWQSHTRIQVRTATDVPVTVALVDCHTSLVSPETGAVSVSRCPETANMLHYLFQGLWEGSAPVVGEDRAPGVGQCQDILRMLAGGLTDQQIAHKLDVSERTVGRTVARIMSELDARSRFEAGVRAARLGWLGTPHR